MNDRNTKQQIRYLEEVCTCLHRAGFETQPLEDSQMPVYWNGTPLCRITGKGSVFYRREDADTPQTEDALYRVEDIAAKTLEYMTAMEAAPQLKASGLDGRPRPINIAHGANVIQWNRTESWVKEELINKVSVIGEGDSWREEKTGLHEWEFIETRRHWFTDKVLHKNESGVNVLNLIEGRSVIVESPIGQFSPFVVHYAETFIIPAAIKEYTIKPYGESEGMECGTIKAFVRHHA